MIHIWRPWKLSIFQDPPPPPLLSIYVQNSSTPLTLDVQFQTNPHLQMITIQLKENIIQGWLFMLSGPSFRSPFVFSINSFILSGFPLTSFHLVDASLSAFSWLYTLVCAVVSIKCLLSIINHIFSTYFAINLFFFHNVYKLWNNNHTVDVNERNQNKSKTKSRHIQIDHGFCCSI